VYIALKDLAVETETIFEQLREICLNQENFSANVQDPSMGQVYHSVRDENGKLVEFTGSYNLEGLRDQSRALRNASMAKVRAIEKAGNLSVMERVPRKIFENSADLS
jgi:predicted S18 family serine protease